MPGRPRRAEPVWTNSCARGMVELVGVHRPDDAQLVGHRRQLRDDVRHHLPGLAEFAELVGRPQQARPLVLDERELLTAYVRLRARQAVQLVQLRLVVEQVQRGRGAGHVEEDDLLGPGRKMRHLRRQRIAHVLGSASEPGIEHGRQGQRSDAHAAVPEELPARAVFQVFLEDVHGGRLAVYDLPSR